MSTNINLLLRNDEEKLKKLSKVKKFNFAAFAFLIGIGVISLIIFLSIQIVNPSSVKKEKEDVLKKILEFEERRAKLFIVNDRINNIQKLLEKRKDLSLTIEAILAKIPSGFSIEGLEVDGSIISLTANSTSLFSIGEFINNLTDMVRKKEIISSLTLTNLAFDQNKNIYQVSIKSSL